MSTDRKMTTADVSPPVLTSETRQTSWRRANLLKYSAHLAVQRALGSGNLEKQPCEVCGVTTVDARHARYDQPLNVRWLCRRHHVKLHRYGEDMFPVEGASGKKPDLIGKGEGEVEQVVAIARDPHEVLE